MPTRSVRLTEALTPLFRIVALWRAQRPILLAGILTALAALAAGIALMAAAGDLIGSATLGIALAVPSVLAIIGLARVTLRYLERLITHDGTFRALAALRVWFFRSLAFGAGGGLGYRSAGDILARLVNDIEALDGIFLRILIPALSALALIPVLIIAIGRESPAAAALALALFVIVAFTLPIRAMARSRQSAAAEAEAGGALRTATLDTLAGLREIKVFGAEGRMLAHVQSQESRLFTAERTLARHTGTLQALAFLAAQAALLTILLIHGTQPVAIVIAAFVVIAAFETAGILPRAGIIAGRAAAAAARVLEAAETPPRVPDPVAPATLPAATSLTFDAVSFRWTPDAPPVFDHLSLQIPAGSRIAVLGPSGAGKSTLAALALKLAAPDSGEIRLGGTNIATLRAQEIHTRITWLAQATHLFADTIANNLRLARPDADDQTIWAALDAAQIGDTIRTLPDQLDTWVGEFGSQFSGGQGRRLALARTLLSPAPILILDEPCAGLDLETEQAFMRTINETLANRTLLLITHRLTGIEKLDRVYRLQNGKLTAATR
ncbi:MAG: thiol reductant ABC exporter subunit CydC [Acidiphilium sp.]|nr:thiol reductant ABC exporter subunit CydC [Acidiphilium sp.]MDD4935267.1 thiol reductant ABC exporter subunit CydC [Acidiphilium sp.]